MSERLIPPDPPFPSGAPWWYWLGGRPSLDFVNTRRERWRRNVDCLVTPADVVDWLLQARVLADDAAPADPAVALLDDARELREAIDAGVRAVVERRPVAPEPLALIDGWLPEAALARRPRLVAGADGHPALVVAPVADAPRRALAAIALDAATLLGGPDRERVRICAAETCSARFFDRSPAGRRRWCSMTGCGNAAKARRHRERHRAGSG